MSLPESLEQAASALAHLADQIRPANGDPLRLLEELNAAEAGELLRWMLGEAASAADELIEAWEDDETGQAVLMGATEEGLAKPGRKLLRRVHHRLRSRGIEVPSAAKPSGPGAGAKRVVRNEDTFEAACLSAPDFRGARVGYLADRHPSGGARLFEIRFDEARGILDFKVYNAGRSKVRGFLRSLSSAQSHSLFDVPRESLCALVRRASLAQPVDRPLPRGFIEWRGRLFSEATEKDPTPGEAVRAALNKDIADLPEETALEVVIGLIAEGEAGPWPPATKWVSDWMDRGREAAKGLEGDARAEAITGFKGELAAALVAETEDDLLRRHLEELAWVHWRGEATGESTSSNELGRTRAASLLRTAELLRTDPAAAERLAGARIEALLAPFFAELEVGDADPADAGTPA